MFSEMVRISSQKMTKPKVALFLRNFLAIHPLRLPNRLNDEVGGLKVGFPWRIQKITPFHPNFLRTFPTLTPGCPGVKNFSLSEGPQENGIFWCGTSTIFGADVHDPKGSRNTWYRKSLHCFFLSPTKGPKYQNRQGKQTLEPLTGLTSSFSVFSSNQPLAGGDR